RTVIPQLYPRLLGPVWFDLPEPLRLLHGDKSLRARGRMRVVNGRRLLARAVLRGLRKPRAGDSVDVRLEGTATENGRPGGRTFDQVRLETWQREATAGLLEERFGFLEFRFRLAADLGALRYEQVSASVRVGPLRLPLPVALAPKVEASERSYGPAGVRVQV